MSAKDPTRNAGVASTLLTLALAALASRPASAEVSFTGQAGPPSNRLVLWYRAPAKDWMISALPIGNGRLGGMVFGGVAQEHLQLNEKSLWTGDAKTYGSYQNLGDLTLDFPGLTTVSNYRRELDLEAATARVTYQVDSTHYTREYFVSSPDNVMVLRLTADSPGKLTVDISLKDAHDATASYSSDGITIAGNLDLLSYEAQLKVTTEGGTMASTGIRLSVKNADSVTILLAAGTDYDPSKPTYKGTAPHGVVSGQISAAAQKGANALESAHLADYQALFRRVSLSLGEVKPTIPTPDVLKAYNSGTRDPFIEILHLPVRPLPDPLVLPRNGAPLEPPGNLEQQQQPTLGFRYPQRHQRPDELLADGSDQPARVFHALLGLPVQSGNQPRDVEGEREGQGLRRLQSVHPE